jgi:ATP-binding cassette subfamily D (ALD) long-chain fatty acid import protein
MEKELQDLRQRLAQVDEWKRRRGDIEDELAAVWTGAGESLPAPSYAEVTKTETETETETETASIESAYEVEGTEAEAPSYTEVEKPESEMEDAEVEAQAL